MEIPKDVDDRCKRGRERLKQVATRRNEALEFWRGNQYVYTDEKNVLQVQPTVTTVRGTGKPRWRARTTRNLILDAVQHEVSAATQRVPSYEVVPATTDPQDISAARLAERVAIYGYDKWDVRKATVDAVTFCVVADEAFAWPYWDTTVGPFIQADDGTLAQGDVRIRVYGGNEVYWEPGTRFEDSPWHAIEHARPLAQAQQEYPAVKLTADADTDRLVARGQTAAKDTRQVLVTEYLERPSVHNPAGRWFCMANGKLLADKGGYPTGDELCFHKLSYVTDPDSDRDFGLVRHLIDAQRTYNDCWNKAIEWKNLALVCQLFVTPGLLRKQRITDEPGAVYEVPQPDQNIKFREVPQIPRELFELADRAQGDIARISAQNDIPGQVESGKAIAALLERDSTRRAEFLANLADWHSRVMRDCLALVAKHYTEDRLLTFRGRFGWEQIRDFRGAKLRDQIDVRVFPGSIEPRTRVQMEQKVLAFADRGWISPQAAMAAINGGYAEDLARSYELDVARANLVIQKIKDGPEVLLNEPLRTETDPLTGMPLQVPSWMPRDGIDNVQVHRSVFSDFAKTPEFDMLEPGMQDAVMQYLQALDQLEMKQAAKAQQQQMAMAQGLGLQNAAKPPGVNGMPDMPQPEGNDMPTPNQPPDQNVPT